MNAKLRRIARELLPPIATKALARTSRRAIRFTEGYGTWAEAQAASTGYDQPAILEKVAAAMRKVSRGEAVHERDSVLFDRIEYSWPVLAGLMWSAARNGRKLAVLDFGGSLGSSYFQNRKFLADLQVSWNIVEQPHFVARGRDEFQDGRLRFHETIEEAAAEAGFFDAVLIGGALQFLEHPYALLERLASIPHRLLVFDSTPFSDLGEDRLCVQHVPSWIYEASYPSHIFSRAGFLRRVESHGWSLLESFDSLAGTYTADRGARFSFEGLLLTR